MAKLSRINQQIFGDTGATVADKYPEIYENRVAARQIVSDIEDTDSTT